MEVHIRTRANVPRRHMYITKVTSKEDFSHREQLQRRYLGVWVSKILLHFYKVAGDPELPRQGE